MGKVLSFPSQSIRKRAIPRRIALTEQRVADLKQEGFHFDTKVTGLAVRITPRGTKTYVFQRKVNNRLVRIALGKCSGLRLDAARAAVENHNGQIALGMDPREQRAAMRVANKPITFAEAYAAFKRSKERRASTEEDYERLWRLHIPAKLKSKPVQEIAASDVESLKSKLMNDRSGMKKANGTAGMERKSGKSRTAAKVITLIASVLNKAGRRNNNPARDVDRPETKVRTRRLNVAEIASVLKVLTTRQGDDFADLIAVALLTGARRGALCAMQWDDLQLEEGIWMVPATWSKNRHELAIALTSKAVEILEARSKKRSKSPWVWASTRSRTGHIVNPDKPLKAILKEAGVSPVSMHDLRRTLGSRLAMTGAGAATITAALGHLSPQSARAYIHIDVDHARAAMEKAIDAT